MFAVVVVCAMCLLCFVVCPCLLSVGVLLFVVGGVRMCALFVVCC